MNGTGCIAGYFKGLSRALGKPAGRILVCFFVFSGLMIGHPQTAPAGKEPLRLDDADPARKPAPETAAEPDSPSDPPDAQAQDRGHEPALDPLRLEKKDFQAPTVAVLSEPLPREMEKAFLLEEPWTVRGHMDGGETFFFELRIEDEAQLWHIEVQKPGLSHIRYLDPGGGTQQRRRADRDTGKAVLHGLYLTPGSHFFSARSRSRTDSAEFTFRAIPLGKPDPHVEREPNDDITRAHKMEFDFLRTGYLYEPDDKDCYRFSLKAPEHLVLTADPPDDLALRLELSEVYSGGRTERIIRSSRRQSPGTMLEYQALLPAGDYLLEVWPDSGNNERSDHPYTLLLERMDPFGLPPDLEPNDSPLQARPLPDDFRVYGSVGQFEGEDWYQLPDLDGETGITITVTEEPDRFDLSLHEDGSTRRARILEQDNETGNYHGLLDSDTEYHLQVSGRGEYRLSLAFDPGPSPAPARPELPVDIGLPESPDVVAAYYTRAQQVQVPVQVKNQGEETLALTWDAKTSNLDWSPVFPGQAVEIDPQEILTVPLTIDIHPDASADEPVRIMVRARDSRGACKTAQHSLVARCGALPREPRQYWPLPSELLGGLNVGWSALGARPLDSGESAHRGMENLFDGYTPIDCGWRRRGRELPVELTVRLAGERPVQVAGVALHPLAGKVQPDYQTRVFDVLVSENGEDFEKVFSGELDRRVREQAFVFDRPVTARYARLIVRSNHLGDQGSIGLGQWKVIAAPGESIAPEGFNIASAELGGHVAWADPTPGRYRTLAAMLTEEEGDNRIRLAESQSMQWVLGFFQQRAARITELQWVHEPESGRRKCLDKVTVSVSTESPLGPWTELGQWDLERTPGGVEPFRFDEPVWARYVLFEFPGAQERSRWQYPRTIRVLEEPADGNYRSILAEWGHYARDAVYELLESGVQEEFGPGLEGHGTRETARHLVPDERVSSWVQVGEKEDWYRIEIPGEENLLQLRLKGEQALRVQAVVQDEKGGAVPTDQSILSPRERLLSMEVQPGETYYVRIHEPPRSVVFAWDNSGSMGPYRATVYQALQNFVQDVKPGLEYANFLPFQGGKPKLLHSEWSDQTHDLQKTLANYHRQDSSSNAEPNLLAATRELADRPGTRAIVVLTDAETHGFGAAEDFWREMVTVRPQIFTVELHSGRNPAYHQQLMQNWAAVNAGHYSRFRSQTDMDKAFDRASCYLRSPARYSLAAASGYEAPPEPDMYDILIQEGRVVTHGIFFDIDSARLRPESYPVLREIGEMLHEHSELRLQIEGHTDNTGTAARNQVLSEERAASVRVYLIENYAVDEGRLEAVGYGQDRPADTNETAAGRQNNRRVELVEIK